MEKQKETGDEKKILTLKEPSKIAADDTLCFFFYSNLSKKIRLDISCESSARQRIHMIHQALFSHLAVVSHEISSLIFFENRLDVSCETSA